MFGFSYNEARLKRAQEKQKKLQEQIKLAKLIIPLETENRCLQTELKLMEQSREVGDYIVKGMNEQYKKSLEQCKKQAYLRGKARTDTVRALIEGGADDN